MLSKLADFFRLIYSAAPKKQNTVVVTAPTSASVVDNEESVMAPSATDPIDLMKVAFDKSPNQSERNDVVRAIVLHHTGPGSFNGIVSWLKNPQAKAASHYVIGYNGELVQLVNTSKKAWHAGVSTWTIDGKIRNDLNNCTIGIEICHPGIFIEQGGKFYYEAGGRGDPVLWKGPQEPAAASITYPSGKVLGGFAIPYPEVQKNKLIALCKGIIQKYPNIGREDILTHFNISTPEGRKNDPFGLNIQEIIDRIFE
jgi:N-acetyl-anhydromuramyl-L-alanine amidase AmpD